MALDTNSCGSWVESRHSRSQWPGGVFLNWAFGYLQGFSEGVNVFGQLQHPATMEDLLAKADVPAMKNWLDNYCKAHPLDSFSKAVNQLGVELLKQQAK